MYLTKEQAEQYAKDLLAKGVNKLEPVLTVNTANPDLNNEARGRLLKEISERMSMINREIIWELQDGRNQAEFARTHTLTEPMDTVADYLDESSKLMQAASDSFELDAYKLKDLAKLAREIGHGEDLG